VSTIINDALSIVSKYPIILLIFLVPGLILMMGGLAISGSGLLENINTATIEDGTFEYGSVIPGIGAAIVLDNIIVPLISIFIGCIAITMTVDVLEGRPAELNTALDRLKDKWVLLLIAAIVLAFLYFIGLSACCIGYVFVAIPTAFVMQGIVLDDLQINESFNNSYNLAKTAWADILMIVIIYIIMWVVLSIVPLIGGIITELIRGFFTVAFTIFYIGLTRNAPAY
jgi:exosortase/archaeosortase